MSIKATTYVWEHSKHKGTKLLMLLALADSANDEGVCYPGHARLAIKARISKTRVADILKELKESGEIDIDVHQGIKTDHGFTNRYYLSDYRESINLPRGVENNPPSEHGGLKITPDEGLNLPSKTIRGTVSKELKDSLAPQNGASANGSTAGDSHAANGAAQELPAAYLYDRPASPGNRTAKQHEGDMLVNILGMALDVYATEADYSFYRAIANHLLKAGLSLDEFADYVHYVRKVESKGDWLVTAGSLKGNGRTSRYFKWRDEQRQRNQPDEDDGVVWTEMDLMPLYGAELDDVL